MSDDHGSARHCSLQNTLIIRVRQGWPLSKHKWDQVGGFKDVVEEDVDFCLGNTRKHAIAFQNIFVFQGQRDRNVEPPIDPPDLPDQFVRSAPLGAKSGYENISVEYNLTWHRLLKKFF